MANDVSMQKPTAAIFLDPDSLCEVWLNPNDPIVSEAALDNFMELVRKVEKTAKVIIILSNGWQEAYQDIDSIKKNVFAKAPFCDLIVDRTTIHSQADQFAMMVMARSGCGVDLRGGSKVLNWLERNANWKSHSIQNFVMIDSGSFAGDKYPQHQVLVKRIFTHEDAKKAFRILTEIPAPPEVAVKLTPPKPRELLWTQKDRMINSGYHSFN